MKWCFIFCFLSFPLLSRADAKPSPVHHATQYPGCQTEKLLNDLLRGDYHAALSKYYRNREKAGFMALERFELALTRAIGDIRTVAYIKDLKERQVEALKISTNWRQAFERAMVKNTPPLPVIPSPPGGGRGDPA
jgi:hypothetical protein